MPNPMNSGMAGIPVNNPVVPQIQNGPNPVDYAESMVKRSGGDAKAAFYLACKEKGVDPNTILTQMQSMGDPRQMLMSALGGNKLMSLLSLVK